MFRRSACFRLLLLYLCSTPILALHFDGSLTAKLPPVVPSVPLVVDEALPHANTSIGVAPLSDLLIPRDLVIRADGSGQSTSAASSGDFTCGPNKPCGNGACCGDSGWCGYSPTYCGTGCQSNCDAKAEGGQYASSPGKACPLNVCCSEFGFCGTTTEFCAAGCQSNCEQPKPSGPKGHVQQKIIAYWESWNENKPCEHMSADEIPVNDISHLIYAFGFVNPGDFDIVNMPDVRPETFREVFFLKNKNPDLKIQVALGGWTHNDPGKWQKVFSDMVSSEANRSKFITNLLGFLAQYGFDGVDFDWEYPGAQDRGGTPEDGVNYTQLLKELRAAIRSSGRDYIVTYTAPTSYWYLRHFDVSGMNQYVDWINLMSYDLHGIWDADNPIGNQILAHTNLTEIDLALDLFWRNNIPPEDIVLGIGFYGRSFKLADKNCWKPGCKFESSDGGGEPGECTGTSGFLSYSEVMNILGSRNAKSTYYDKDAQVKYLTYGQNSWISYDDAETFQKKTDFANDRGMSGLMIWAIDLYDDRHSALSALTGQEVEDPLALPISSLPTIGHSTDDASQCRVTDCGGFCNQGETPVGRVKSLFGDHKKACKESRDARYVCCPAWTSLDADDCYWDAGGGAVQTDCSGKCQDGDIKLFGDSWGWKGDLVSGEYDYVCARGGKAFCCAAGNKQRFLDICTWSDCGPRSNPRCDAEGSIGPKRDEMNDATKGAPGFRKLCCPKPDSFKNCKWKGAKVCSDQCDNGQITLDLDPRGPGEKACDNGREQVFCCDVPGRKDQPFLPVDLDKLFPPEYLPPADALPQFELVGFNGRATIGNANPGETGVAFFLIAGSDTAVSSMRKRGDSGVVFLDCPADILDAPLDRIHTARVICLDADVEDCLKVQKNGVEGTVVHMPNECGNGSFSRAVSLMPSENQSIPLELARKNPTSAVYDFSFDYNMPLVRRDAGRFSIRMDYSNVKGYWDTVADSPGVQKRDLDDLVKRFYSGNNMDWVNKFNDLPIGDSGTLSDIGKSKLEHLVYFEQEMCTVDDKQRGQGIAAAIQGELNAGFFYGFSMIATWDPASTVKVHQSAGFLHPVGTTSAAYTVSGIGTLDTSQKLNGASLRKSSGQQAIGGHGLYHGWASVTPYKEETVTLKSEGQNGPAVAFNGYMEAKIEVDWGDNINVHFPRVTSGVRAKNLALQRNSKLTPLRSGGQVSGRVTIGSSIKLGIKTSMYFSRPYQFAVDGDLPDLSVTQNVAASFNIQGDENSICLDTKVYQSNDATLVHADLVGWGDDYKRQYLEQSFGFQSDECWNANTRRSEGELPGDTLTERAPSDGADSGVKLPAEVLPAEGSDRDADEVPKAGNTKKKRQNNSVPGDFSGYEGMPNLRDLLDRDSMNGLIPEINCMPCAPCGLSIDVRDCCECAWLPPDEDTIFGIIGSSPFRKRSAAEELHELFERARSIGTGRKLINFFNDWQTETELYPQYPNYYMIPQNDADWDGSRYGAVKKYFHNTTALCTSFDVSQATTADVMYPYPHTGYRGFTYARGVGYHQMYQTEHVFEGQTLARFFNSWLLGKPVGDPRRRDQSWIEQNIFTQTINTWGNQPLVNALADELGSVDHLNRLTVFMSKPNLMKGNLFGGGVSISQAKFTSYPAGPDQLYAARQVGMIFTYLNIDTVWESFCDTYNGMLDLFEKFDQWYDIPGDTSYLAAEWPKFIRAELDRVVRTARSDLKMMDQRRSPAGVLYATRWLTVMNVALGEIQKIKLERTDKCRNLPASTAGRYTG